MKILALEFSSSQRSVAIVNSRQHAGSHDSAVAATELVETGVSGTDAFRLIQETLDRSGLERQQVDCLAIGLGPGSYTGVRAAIAIAQGWQLASAVKLCGVSSARCLAAQAEVEGITGRINVVIDAQREEFYLGTYEIGAGECREIAPLKITTLADVREREHRGEVLVGPEVARWFPRSRMLFPRAEMIGRLASLHESFITGEGLVPIYLRETTFVKAPIPKVF